MRIQVVDNFLFSLTPRQLDLPKGRRLGRTVNLEGEFFHCRRNRLDPRNGRIYTTRQGLALGLNEAGGKQPRRPRAYGMCHLVSIGSLFSWGGPRAGCSSRWDWKASRPCVFKLSDEKNILIFIQIRHHKVTLSKVGDAIAEKAETSSLTQKVAKKSTPGPACSPKSGLNFLLPAFLTESNEFFRNMRQNLRLPLQLRPLFLKLLCLFSDFFLLFNVANIDGKLSLFLSMHDYCIFYWMVWLNGNILMTFSFLNQFIGRLSDFYKQHWLCLLRRGLVTGNDEVQMWT